MNKFWCFVGVHSYKIVEKGGVVNDYNVKVGFWTLRVCEVCQKAKYKQHC